MEMSDEMLDSCILLVSNAGKALLGPGPDEELSTEMKILAKLADGQVRHNKATCIMLLHKAATLECLGLCTDVSAKSLHVCRKSGQRGVCFRSLGQQVGVLILPGQEEPQRVELERAQQELGEVGAHVGVRVEVLTHQGERAALNHYRGHRGIRNLIDERRRGRRGYRRGGCRERCGSG